MHPEPTEAKVTCLSLRVSTQLISPTTRIPSGWSTSLPSKVLRCITILRLARLVVYPRPHHPAKPEQWDFRQGKCPPLAWNAREEPSHGQQVSSTLQTRGLTLNIGKETNVSGTLAENEKKERKNIQGNRPRYSRPSDLSSGAGTPSVPSSLHVPHTLSHSAVQPPVARVDERVSVGQVLHLPEHLTLIT